MPSNYGYYSRSYGLLPRVIDGCGMRLRKGTLSGGLNNGIKGNSPDAADEVQTPTEFRKYGVYLRCLGSRVSASGPRGKGNWHPVHYAHVPCPIYLMRQSSNRRAAFRLAIVNNTR